MQAGKLRHRIRLERRTDAVDAHGDQTPTWSSLCTVWAAIEDMSGREFIAAAMAQAELNVRIRMRAQSGIRPTPKDRVVYDAGSRTFDIRHVIDWGDRGVEWQLLCTERLDGS